jgi:hypothetical protein
VRYGVIVCPRCGMAKGVETRSKTTTCQCGRKIKLYKRNVKYQTESPIELAQTVAEVNAALQGGGARPPVRRAKPPARSPILDKAMSAKTPADRLRTMAEELSRKDGDFGVEDLKPLVNSMGRSPETVIKMMLEAGMIYESSPGRYRSV